MRLEVLGRSGGELPGHRTTCFLVDGRLAVDAGALTASLSLPDLLRVDDVLLTHSHFDHVKDIPLLADLVIGRRRTPIRVHASRACVKTLRESIFNGALWPDFTRIPDRAHPVVTLHPFSAARPFRLGRDARYTVRAVPVNHPVDSMGFVVSAGRSAFAISGDTGPTARFWRAVNAAPRLSALLVELSYPTARQALADVSGHLTPRTLAAELAKVARDVPVHLYHLKPAYEAELRAELRALRLPRVRVLERGDVLSL